MLSEVSSWTPRHPEVFNAVPSPNAPCWKAARVSPVSGLLTTRSKVNSSKPV